MFLLRHLDSKDGLRLYRGRRARVIGFCHALSAWGWLTLKHLQLQLTRTSPVGIRLLITCGSVLRIEQKISARLFVSVPFLPILLSVKATRSAGLEAELAVSSGLWSSCRLEGAGLRTKRDVKKREALAWPRLLVPSQSLLSGPKKKADDESTSF